MKIIGLLALFVCSVAFSEIHITKNDPYDKRLPDEADYILTINVYGHGFNLKGIKSFLKSQIQAAEIIYSQCGPRIKIKTNIIKSSKQIRDLNYVVKFENEQISFTEEILNLFQDILLYKSPDILDIHLIDHLNPKIRETKSTKNQSIELGISFNPRLVGIIWNGSVPEIAGQHVFIAIKTVEMVNKNFLKIHERRGYPRNLSLLAHEIGHQVLEGQNPVHGYKDHWCDGISDSCPIENLMTAGGNQDRIWINSSKNKTEGFDFLPKLDKRQCDLLINHHLIKKVN